MFIVYAHPSGFHFLISVLSSDRDGDFLISSGPVRTLDSISTLLIRAQSSVIYLYNTIGARTRLLLRHCLYNLIEKLEPSRRDYLDYTEFVKSTRYKHNNCFIIKDNIKVQTGRPRGIVISGLGCSKSQTLINNPPHPPPPPPFIRH